jgi:hypothetical protein
MHGVPLSPIVATPIFSALATAAFAKELLTLPVSPRSHTHVVQAVLVRTVSALYNVSWFGKRLLLQPANLET